MPENIDWNQNEIDAAVEAYFVMLGDQISGRHIVKARVMRALKDGPLTRRTLKSIEYKLCNVTAILRQASLPSVEGLSPKAHVQQALRTRVHEVARERHLA